MLLQWCCIKLAAFFEAAHSFKKVRLFELARQSAGIATQHVLYPFCDIIVGCFVHAGVWLVFLPLFCFLDLYNVFN